MRIVSVPLMDDTGEEANHETPLKNSFVFQAGNENGGNTSSTSNRFCSDCRLRAKKEFEFVRCRRCCRAKGYDCPTHVNSTWLPASSRYRGGGCFSPSSTGGGRREPPTVSKGNERRILVLGEKSRRIQTEIEPALKPMSVPSLDSSSTAGGGGYELEFHSPIDDAWYSVRAIFDGRKKELTVKFENFEDREDFVVEAESFGTLGELKEFIARFRPVSHQLQDWECQEVTKGKLVCVSHSVDGFDNRFFDATIDEVIHKDHSVVKGEEVCNCIFVVVGEHGPVKYQLHRKKIETICIVQSDSQRDPAVANFLEVARQEIEGGACFKDPPPPPSCHDFAPAERKGSQRSAKRTCSMKGDADFKIRAQEGLDVCDLPSLETSGDEDADMMGGRYALLVDNLEKDISPSAIVQFVHRNTSALVEAHIASSFFYETCTKAAIVVDSKEKFQRVCNFLDSPDHFVTSWTGRPLLVTEKSLPLGMYGITSQANYAQRKKWLPEGKEKEGRGLKIVERGSEEYRRAKQLKDLFMEFAEQQKCFFRTLTKTENEIQQRLSSTR